MEGREPGGSKYAISTRWWLMVDVSYHHVLSVDTEVSLFESLP